jgi:PhnB protein
MKPRNENISTRSTVTTSIAPWLTVHNSRTAVNFYKTAFGAVELYRMEGDNDDLVAKLSIDGAEFWISNGSSKPDRESLKNENLRMILTVSDPDAMFLKALNAGATRVFPVGEEHDWRLGRLMDPFGLHWEIGRPLK